jgi:hypothetical protein
MYNKSETILARLALGAATSTVIGSVALHTGEIAASGASNRSLGVVSSIVESIPTPNQENAFAADTIEYPVPDQPDEWGATLEKEFRALALKEAKGSLTFEEFNRLNRLTFWRDTMSVPRTGEEILLQIQRDRVVDKVSEALEEYVQFQKTSRAAGRIA